jgi:hypothetical protein
MLINEIGWPTQGGGSTISEEERSKAYTAATENIPRTNCNVMGMLPQAWTSVQQDPRKPEDWYGIAGPVTAKPYPSAHAYSRAAKLMRGQLSQAPPGKPLMMCPGMPAPTSPGANRPSHCTILGTADADRLAGTGKRDVVCGFGGRDVIHARRGRDRLKGGPGQDVLVGGPGRDTCYGGRGRDRFRGCERIVSR